MLLIKVIASTAALFTFLQQPIMNSTKQLPTVHILPLMHQSVITLTFDPQPPAVSGDVTKQ